MEKISNKSFVQKVLEKLRQQKPEEVSIIQSPKVDYRRSPRMEHPTLDLTQDFLWESKCNRKFLEESFI